MGEQRINKKEVKDMLKEAPEDFVLRLCMMMKEFENCGIDRLAFLLNHAEGLKEWLAVGARAELVRLNKEKPCKYRYLENEPFFCGCNAKIGDGSERKSFSYCKTCTFARL